MRIHWFHSFPKNGPGVKIIPWRQNFKTGPGVPDSLGVRQLNGQSPLRVPPDMGLVAAQALAAHPEGVRQVQVHGQAELVLELFREHAFFEAARDAGDQLGPVGAAE